MTVEEIITASPSPDMIGCSWLYRKANGYDCDGGLYDSVQSHLEKNGWRYDIVHDAWFRRPAQTSELQQTDTK
jgi:hypothetical protein